MVCNIIMIIPRSLRQIIMSFTLVSELDVCLLYERFQQLKPDRNGFINRNVFEADEYCDPFCRQVSSLINFSNPLKETMH